MKREVDILRELIAEGDKSQAEIARKIGTSRQQISKWVNEKGAPKLSKLYEIADFLGFRIAVQIIKKD